MVRRFFWFAIGAGFALFVYVKRSSFDDDENVRDFVEYMLENEQKIAEEARFVPLSDAQLAEQQSKLEDAAS